MGLLLGFPVSPIVSHFPWSVVVLWDIIMSRRRHSGIGKSYLGVRLVECQRRHLPARWFSANYVNSLDLSIICKMRIILHYTFLLLHNYYIHYRVVRIKCINTCKAHLMLCDIESAMLDYCNGKIVLRFFLSRAALKIFCYVLPQIQFSYWLELHLLYRFEGKMVFVIVL